MKMKQYYAIRHTYDKWTATHLGNGHKIQSFESKKDRDDACREDNFSPVYASHPDVRFALKHPYDHCIWA